MLRVRGLLNRLNLNQKHTARGMHINDIARSLAVDCSADGGESRNAMLTDIRVAWPSERVYFPLAGLDVANMNSGSDRDDFFIESLEQHGKSSEGMS
jgi:hypothetical protein